MIRQYFVRALRASACQASEGSRMAGSLSPPYRRVVYALHARMVFVTNRRGKVFNIAYLKRIEEICRDVCSDFEAELKEFNGERDHVSLLVIYPPKVRLSELVNSLKGVSSRLLKVEFAAIPTFWSVRKSQGAPWSPSYFVVSVGGAPIENPSAVHREPRAL
jgi:putative transposase